MKHFKSTTSLLLVCLLLVTSFSLAGCKKREDDDSYYYSYISTFDGEDVPGTQTDGQKKSETNTSDTASEKSKSKKVKGGTYDYGDDAESISKLSGKKVKFATWVDHTTTEAASVIASFVDKYGIKVEMVHVGQAEYAVKLTSLVAAGQSPDIVVQNGDFPALSPLVQRLDKISSINVSDSIWNKTITELYKVNGVPYFVNRANTPWTFYGCVLYDKKIFEENGFKTPDQLVKENNWTMDTFKEAATRVSKLGSEYIGAFAMPEYACELYGTQLVTIKNGKFYNNSGDANLQKAFRWLMEGVDAKIFNPLMDNNNFRNFIDHKVGLILYKDFGLRKSSPFRSMDPNDIGYVPLPKVNASDSSYPSMQELRAYGICKGAKNPEAAGYFLKYFLDGDNYTDSDVYLSKDMGNFVRSLRSSAKNTMIYVTDGVLQIIDGYGANIGILNTITDSTAAQVSVNISKISNRVQACVDEANKVMNKVIKEQ